MDETGLQTRSRDALGSLLGDLESKKAERRIVNLPAEQLFHFHKHPFRVDQAEIEEIAESIRENGIIEPVIVRPIGRNKYEILSGHRRTEGGKLAGLTEIPCIIENVDDDRAICIMVESNMHHRKLLFSERANAYRMEYEALERLGASAIYEILAEQEKTSTRSVYRYLRLSFLITGFMEMVDTKKLNFTIAVDISYLAVSEQEKLLEMVQTKAIILTKKTAAELKETAKDNEKFDIFKFFATVAKRPKKISSVSIRYAKLKSYFPPDTKPKEIEDNIIEALEFFRQHHK